MTDLSLVASLLYLELTLNCSKKSFNFIALYSISQVMLFFSYCSDSVTSKNFKFFLSFLLLSAFTRKSTESVRRGLSRIFHVLPPLLSATLRVSTVKTYTITIKTSLHEIKWFWLPGQLFFFSITKEFSEDSKQFFVSLISFKSFHSSYILTLGEHDASQRRHSNFLCDDLLAITWHAIFNHAMPRRNLLHSKSHLNRSCIHYQTICNFGILRDILQRGSEAKTCELNNMSAETSPESMVDFESAMYMANAFLMPCFFDAECKLPQKICELVEGGRKCKGNVGNLF